MRRRIIVGVAIAVALCAAYLLAWPVPIDPVAWTPPPAPALEGPYARNDALAATKVLAVDGAGPEDVAVDADGRPYGGLDDGRIIRLEPDGTGQKTFADTGGRPLGLDFDGAGNLIVADAEKGLLSVAPDGKITVLATEQGGVPFKFADDVDVAPDGTIYFSDASSKWDRHHYREDVLEHRPNGRLLAYDPKTRATRLVAGDLYFANGVAVSPDGSFVLVNETAAYRVNRIWLTGSRAGQRETFVENLPGFPDGISTGADGVYWLALFAPRSADLDGMLPSPLLRKVAFRLPESMQPQPARHGFVLGLDDSGKVVRNLQHDAPESYAPITSVEQVGDTLFLGSLVRSGIGKLPVSREK